MIKVIYIIIFLTFGSFAGTLAYAETKPDCSQYSTKTFAGLSDKIRCKKGLAPRENVFGFFKVKSKKTDSATGNTIVEEKKNCDEYTTKTFAGLFAKMTCKRR